VSWVRCYEAATEPEAHMVRGFLEERGVPCVLRPLGPSIYPVAFGMEVLVPPDWQQIAHQYLRRRRRPSRRVVNLSGRRRRA
jgi:hypothetical protein